MPEGLTVGLIMPHAADVLPPEGMELYPQLRFMARGVGVTSLTPQGYDDAVGNILPAARMLAEKGVAAITVFGTSLSFYRGVEFNSRLIEQIRDATGLPVSTMSTAIADALRAVGARRIIACTAYADEVNERLRSFLTDSGFEVLGLKGLGIERFGSAGGVSAEEIMTLAAELCVEAPGAEGLLISCGGLRTLRLAVPLEEKWDIPVVSSTPAAFWKSARLVGGNGFAAGYGRLFEVGGSSLH